MSELSEMIRCCGSDCSTCYCYGEMCKGCNAICGKVFHAPDGKECPIYYCCPITISSANEVDYICITDMATAKSDNSRAADIIKNWLRNRNTLELRKPLKNCSILQSYG